MPGGKGVNVARTLKTLGQPVIATGFAGGATGTRIVEQLTAASRSSATSCASARSRARTPPWSTRRPASRPRSTSAARRSPSSEVELFRDKLLYLAQRRRASSSSPARCRAASTPTSTRALIRELRRLGVTTVVDTDGEPLRRARARRAGRHLAERARGRGARRPRVQRRGGPRRRRARDGRARRARGDHDAARRLRRAASLVDGAAARCYRVRIAAARGRRARSAPATRSSPATSPPATAARRPRSACATASPAARSPPSASAPGSSIRSGVERLLGEVDVERVERPPTPSEPQLGLARFRRGACYPRRVTRCRRHAVDARSSTPSARGRLVRPEP